MVPGLPRVVVQLFLEHPRPPLMQSSLPPGHHENHLIWVYLSLMAPLELNLVSEHLWPPLTWSSPSGLFREPSDLSELDPNSPLWLHANFPLELFLRKSMLYCILCIYCTLFTFHITFHSPMSYSANIQIFLPDCFNYRLSPIIIMMFKFIVLYSNIVWLLFNYCSLFWSMEMYSRISIPKLVNFTCNFKSINIIQYKIPLLPSA
jgi:hypothetical protein